VSVSFLSPGFLWLLLLLPLYGALAWRLGVTQTRTGRVAVGLRALWVGLLVLALAELSLLQRHQELSTVFVVDSSRSISGPGEGVAGGSAQARGWVEGALAQLPEGDRAGVILFGAEAEIEALVREGRGAPLWASRPEGGGTDIEAALRLALASFPADTHRRVVLLSDGVQTRGDALRQAAVARELGVPVDVIPLEGAARGPDLIAEALSAPPEVEAEEPFALRLQVRAPRAMTARARLYRGDALLGESEVALQPGLDVVSFPQVLTAPGLHRFRVVLEADGDAEPRNNEALATVQVGGTPRVLLLEGYEGGAAHLEAALVKGGFAVQVGSAAEVPDTLEEMAPWDAILLSDVSATDLTQTQLRALASYVEDLGRGLVMLGGDRSFGLGGYYKTPVERVLPVRMTREAQLQLPSQGIVMAIDRSGSMAGFGATGKLELAKEAAVAVVELMSPRDEVGVLGFDSAAIWVSPYARLTDPDEVMRRIGTLRADGGTDIYNALREAHRGIRGGDAATRHIILLSDGISDTSDFPKIIAELRKDKITLTTVSIGGDSDRFTMERLSQLGGGRYYETEDPEAIPRIFTREMMLSSRSFLIEERFVPAKAQPSEILRGLEALPPLDGMVATTAKPRATVALQRPDGEPLLVHWRAGLGKSLAFTSDAKGRWASAWLADPAVYQPFWGQALRWVTQTGSSEALALATSLQGGELTLTVDALDDQVFREGAETRGVVLHPGGRREEVLLRQIAPGRYRARVDAQEEGTYHVAVVQRVNGEELGRAVRELHRPWSPEFAPAGSGAPLLQSLAAATGGRLSPTQAQLWERPAAPITTPTPLVPQLLIALVLLWLLDITWRRFEGLRPPARHPAPTPRPAPLARPLPGAAPSPAPALDLKAGPPAPAPPAEPPSPAPAAPTSPPPAFTNRLLDAKRRSQRK
jgi:Ca-activated chloride channel family protein